MAKRQKRGASAGQLSAVQARLLAKMDTVAAIAAVKADTLANPKTGPSATLESGSKGTLSSRSPGTLSSGSYGTLSSGSFGTLAMAGESVEVSVRRANPKDLHELTGGLLAARQNMDAKNRFQVTIDCVETAGLLKELGRAAERLTETKIIAAVPPADLFKLAGRSDVNRIEASVLVPPKLNVAHRKANLVSASGQRLTDRTGAGVLVGIVDTGIDGGHRDFWSGNRPRIVDYWDQTQANMPRFSAAAGAYISAGEARQCEDEHGHGTHVAGIAAGTGTGNAKYTGVAPEADLAIVKTSFQSADIARAVAHIFRTATARQQPCVVNLSLGGHWGGHDGSTLTERVIDELCDRPGRVVVAAAGNEGSDRVHASTVLRELPAGPGGRRRWTADFELHARIANGMLVGGALVQVWTQREDRLSVTLRSPLGDVFVVPERGFPRWANSFYTVEGVREESALSGDSATAFSIAVQPDTRLLDGWSIIVEELEPDSSAVGAVHAWIVDGGARFNNGFVRSHLVGMPATAFSAITVGSFGSHRDWPASTGGSQAAPETSLKPDDISYFSSRGPTRDGHTKPEIAAPGQWVVAALSSQAKDRVGKEMQLKGGKYAAMQGTSMAAPYVAGAVALLLQGEPNVTWAEVKRRLIKSAKQDSFSLSCWNEAWGYGKMDVERFLTINP